MSTELTWFKSSYSGGSGNACVEVAVEWRKSSYSGNEGSCVEVAVEWHKSSYSGAEGNACVEVAVEWHKSSYSGAQGEACVEVAACPGAVHIRDSKDTAIPALTVTAPAWAAFVAFAAARRP